MVKTRGEALRVESQRFAAATNHSNGLLSCPIMCRTTLRRSGSFRQKCDLGEEALESVFVGIADCDARTLGRINVRMGIGGTGFRMIKRESNPFQGGS